MDVKFRAFDVPTILSSLKENVVPFFYTWYGAALSVFVLFNFKALPFVWTARTYYHLNTAFRNQQKRLVKSSDGGRRKVALVRKENVGDSIEKHPLFKADIISTYVPLLEIDMNLHKSNSTFFTDLDVSRIKLMGRIIAPVWPMDDMEVEYKGRDGKDKKEKIKGRPALILGATHTSFKRELRPYASYNVESRILGWDSRWIYVGSWFLSKSTSKKKVYATSLSKYIIKKGRITVRPEQFFVECGWIPAQEADNNEMEKVVDGEAGWSRPEVDAHKEKGMQIVKTWGEANVLMEQEYED
ncbi:hypothetical protein M441DRAFT_59385 [Trichoderma asperellum CBS 433.97]|uniref:Uncharacterized protein n=1 Tax=Trichoderma asperellum (strain ATCC 204424 / CBS 433.97 / NBRC 101777) TaxID=1042311 RepID=A0A2T3Z3C7_TRIA4|nr:hypothetical protein M441DRAFT_59385 [Trichoderma asperellum CBS 433.97]PTB39328.1 hypothetical protein M441DRAFT_59385 [Trichoderma asperellum CBS 433.97]